jgi:hypothetical protein
MHSGAVSDREAITAVLDRFDAAQADVAALARRCGYRATYPSLSRTTLAPRLPRDAHAD